MQISQSAFDLIVAEEVTSKAYYEMHYTRPEWPGGASGVTVGVGYDLGYATVAKIKADWSKHVPIEMLTFMCSCAGVKGNDAKGLLPKVKPFIEISWAAALDVFANRDIPSWTAEVIRHIPKAASLSSTCLGVIVGLAYNRGSSFDNTGDRFAEMRAIKFHIQNGMLREVAADLRAMKRLWPGVKGLINRREHEAALWEKGLTARENATAALPAQNVPATPSAPAPDVPLKDGPARTKPPATTKTQNLGTAAIVVGGPAVALQAHKSGLLTPEVAIFAAFLTVLAGITAWVIWHRKRNPK